MASIRREITVSATPAAVWDAIADIGAVHTRLAPGFVTATVLEAGARVVTFGNGVVAKELIVDCDPDARRLVWSVVDSERLTHHNASVQVFSATAGARVVWIADILPDSAREAIAGMIDAGMAVMQTTLDRLGHDKLDGPVNGRDSVQAVHEGAKAQRVPPK